MCHTERAVVKRKAHNSPIATRMTRPIFIVTEAILSRPPFTECLYRSSFEFPSIVGHLLASDFSGDGGWKKSQKHGVIEKEVCLRRCKKNRHASGLFFKIEISNSLPIAMCHCKAAPSAAQTHLSSSAFATGCSRAQNGTTFLFQNLDRGPRPIVQTVLASLGKLRDSGNDAPFSQRKLDLGRRRSVTTFVDHISRFTMAEVYKRPYFLRHGDDTASSAK